MPLLFLDVLSTDGNNIPSTTEEIITKEMEYSDSNHMYLDKEKSSTHDNNSDKYATGGKLFLLFVFFLWIIKFIKP